MQKRNRNLFLIIFVIVSIILWIYIRLLPPAPRDMVDPISIFELSESKDPKTGQPLFKVLFLSCKDQYRPPVIILKDSEGNLWMLYTDNDPKGWVVHRKTKSGIMEKMPLDKIYEGRTEPKISW